MDRLGRGIRGTKGRGDAGIGHGTHVSESCKSRQTKKGNARNAGSGLCVKLSRGVKRIGGLLVKPNLGLDASPDLAGVCAVVPLIEPRGTKGQATQVEMLIDEPTDVRVNKHRMLGDKNDIDAHMPMRFKSRDAVGNLDAKTTRSPDFLNLIENDHIAGLCPRMPFVEVIAVYMGMLKAQVFDVGEETPGDGYTVFLDGGAGNSRGNLGNSVDGLGSTWGASDENQH